MSQCVEPWKFVMNAEGKKILAFTNRRHLYCDCCKAPIYFENAEYEQDPCYQLESGVTLCEDCVEGYIKDRFFVELREV